MGDLAKRVERTYLLLTLGNTLAGSFIWGINTLFLLDAGLTNLEAFAANGFFMAGMVVFEVPTGVVADTWGRRASYLLGTVTLAITTALYWLMWWGHAPFYQWAIVSMMLGLGFTFFSGAVEAWLVDALQYAGYPGKLETVFGRGQMVGGVAMLGGSVLGGVVAQVTDLGVPFLLRTGVLIVMFVVAALLMKDLGFVPDRSEGVFRSMKTILRTSLEHGWSVRPVRWVALAGPFTFGAGFYAFYAVQPYLLELSGRPGAYSIAGLAAALVAGSQIVGGAMAPWMRGWFERRTSFLMLANLLSATMLVLLGVTPWFTLAIVLIAIWGMVFAAESPIRQAYLNDMIPSKQRATVLSFASLLGNSGGVVIQPTLGRAADLYGYPLSFVASGIIALFGLPFVALSRKQNAAADYQARS